MTTNPNILREIRVHRRDPDEYKLMIIFPGFAERDCFEAIFEAGSTREDVAGILEAVARGIRQGKTLA